MRRCGSIHVGNLRRYYEENWWAVLCLKGYASRSGAQCRTPVSWGKYRFMGVKRCLIQFYLEIIWCRAQKVVIWRYAVAQHLKTHTAGKQHQLLVLHVSELFSSSSSVISWSPPVYKCVDVVVKALWVNSCNQRSWLLGKDYEWK